MLASKMFHNIFGRIKYDPSRDTFNTDTWPTEHPKEEWIIESHDHLELGGWLYRNDSDIYVIFVHGYHADIRTQGAVARVLHDEMGWNVLLISPRGTGISEGEYITFGYQERYDIVKWAWELSKREPNAKIILFGWSMGAHSIMGALGEELPKNVIAAVCDSGYCNPDEQIFKTLRARYRFLPFQGRMMDQLDSFCLSDYDFSINYTVEEGLMLNHIPVLFIHGVKDSLVPPSESIRAHKANAGKKQILLIEDADHCESFFKARDAYMRAFRNLIRKLI